MYTAYLQDQSDVYIGVNVVYTTGNMANYYTKSEIDAMIGDIGTILDNINGEVA